MKCEKCSESHIDVKLSSCLKEISLTKQRSYFEFPFLFWVWPTLKCLLMFKIPLDISAGCRTNTQQQISDFISLIVPSMATFYNDFQY